MAGSSRLWAELVGPVLEHVCEFGHHFFLRISKNPASRSCDKLNRNLIKV